MKRKFTLFLFALITSLGAWADTSITVNTGSPLTSVSQISTDKYYVLYNQGRGQYMNINPATGQVLLTTSLPTSSDAALLPFIVRFESNTNAKAEGDAYQLKFYDGTYLPWQSSGSGNYVTKTKGYNNSNNEGYVPTYSGSYFSFQVYKNLSSRTQWFDGNSGSFTFWNNSGTGDNAKYQIYEAECDDFQEIAYKVNLGGNVSSSNTKSLLTVKSSTIALPTAIAKDEFYPYLSTSYLSLSAIEASSDGSAITLPATVSYPFETTALVAGDIPASAPLYRLKGNVGNTPKYIKRSEGSVVYKADDGVTTDDYFCFTGNAVDGYRIYNVGAGTSVNLGSDSPSQGTSPALTNKDHIWRLYKNSDGFGFQQKKTDDTDLSNAYLCNVSSLFTYWISSAAESSNDGGARMLCERVTFDVTDETWVRVGDGDYELIGSITNTYNSGDAYVENVLTTTATGVALTNDDVEDAPTYVSGNTTVKYYYTSATALTLPFTTTTISAGEFVSPTWYYMTINGYPAYADGKMKADNSKGNLYYDRWCFVGDAATGVQIYCDAMGATKPLRLTSFANNARAELTTTTTNSHWNVIGTGLSDIKFSQSNGTTYYLNQLGGSGGSSYNWEIGMYDGGGSIVVLTPASDANAESKIEAAITAITGNDAYINQGQLAYPSTSEYNALNTKVIAASTSQTADNYSAMIKQWRYYLLESAVVYPTGGKFYRIKGVDSGRYLTCEAAPSKSDRLGASETKTPNTIFLLEGAYNSCKLLGYTNGFYTYNTCQEGSLALDDQTYVLNVPGTLGEFSIKGGGYLYSWTDSKMYFDRNGDTYASQCHMIIEPVDELPITMHEVDGEFFGTINLPVAVTLPSGLSAYSATASVDVLTLAKVVEGDVLAANQPVILYSASNVTSLNIASTAGTAAGSNDLDGTTTAIAAPDGTNYVLSANGSDVVGFYKYTGSTMPGFKAYYNVPAASPVKGFTFSFEDAEDAIRAIESENSGLEIYDISGRRVQKAQKGLYIVNGKKVMFK